VQSRPALFLLILVSHLSAAGTIILQRPATEPDEMQRAYSPQVLRVLRPLRLTTFSDAWWFVLLLSLVSLSIIAAYGSAFPQVPGDFFFSSL